MSKTTVKTPKGRVNMISGVDLGRLNEKRLRSILIEKLGVPTAEATSASTEQCTVIAATRIEKMAKDTGEDLLICDECGGSCTSAFDECIYCHVEEGEAAEAEKPKTKKEAAARVAAETAKMKADLKAEADAAKKAKKEEAAPPPVVVSEETAEDDEGEEPDNESKEDDQNMTTETDHVNGKASTALVPSNKNKSTEIEKVGTVKALDGHIKRFKQHLTDAKNSVWSLGKEIAAIHDQKLWSLRLNEDKKQAFRSFEAWCKAELQIDPTTALKWKDLAAHYTVEQIEAYGITKLNMALQAPPEKKAEVEEKIKAGASKREIAKTVQDMNKGRAKKGRDGVDRKPGKAQAAKAEKKAKLGEKITIANIVGTKTIKGYREPEGKDFVLKDLARAKSIKDKPYFRYELENGVVQEFRIVLDDEGNFTMKLKTFRVD